MSYTELHIGKLHKLHKLYLNGRYETLNEQIIRILKHEGYWEKDIPTEEYQLLPFLLDKIENKYIMYNDNLYIIDDTEKEESEDIIEAKIVSKDTIEYMLKFYNGGAGFYECLTEAIENLK